jgi:tetratricopeptide (TPR) repeat protein
MVKKRFSKKKELLFKIIAIALPFLFLIFLEGALRLFKYGERYELFVENKDYPEYLYLNPEVTKKYFTISENATVGARESFLKEKPGNAFRVFVLGASTVVGFPYYHNGSFTRMLKYHLQFQNPDKHMEVINLALTAVNTYTILDFAKQLPEYEPDLVILYTGHNEYYGALGVGSTSSLVNNPAVIRSYIKLQKFRVFQLVIKVVNQFRNVDQELVDLSKTLMHRMTGEKEIPYQSKLYDQGIRQFEQNIDRILKTLSNNEIPTIIGTLASNLKDQKPLSTDCSEESREIIDLNSKAFDSLQEPGDRIQALKRAIGIDSLCGGLYYWLGKYQYSRGEYTKARKHFLKAKKLDQLRFRAPSIFNKIINQKARKYNVAVAEIKDSFERHSENGLVGEKLMLEHVHPTLNGQYLMAKTFYNTLSEMPELQKRISPTRFIHYDELPLTRVDSLYGLYNTWILKEQWPFNEQMPEVEKENPTFEEKLAGNLAVKQITWGDAMNTFYQHYIENKNYKKALEVTEWLILEFPYDLRFYKKAGKLAEQIEDYNKSVFYYKKMFNYRSDNTTAQKLFINYLRLDQPDKALPYINHVLSNTTNKARFTPLKNISRSISRLKEQLGDNPEDAGIMLRITQLYTKIGNYVAARKYLTKLENTPKNREQIKQFNSLVDKIPEE